MIFTEILTIVFVVLRLIGAIDWSWWLVLLPEIIAVVFYVLVVIASLRATASMNRSFARLYEKERKRMNRF